MIYESLERKGYFDIRVGPQSVRLHARGHLGIIPINDRLILEVVPRVPLANLARLLSVSGLSPRPLLNAVRHYDREGAMYPSLAAIYAAGLRERIEAITSRGLMKDYRRQEELTSFPHGRVHIGRTMYQASARGATHRAGVTYFHRSVDNAPNRCLLLATWRLFHYIERVGSSLHERQARRARRDLNYCIQQLQGVRLDLDEGFLSDELVTGRTALPMIRSYYRAALDLALTVIGREGVALERGGSDFRLPSLVIDMAAVFEAYVRATLVRTSRQENWPVRVLDGNKGPPVGGRKRLFDTGIDVGATPDVVIVSRRGLRPSPPLLIEVKYKPARDLPDRNDLNQAITYAVSYGAQCLMLVQPRSEGSYSRGPETLGAIEGVTIRRFVMDLGAANLVGEEDELGQAVRAMGLWARS